MGILQTSSAYDYMKPAIARHWVLYIQLYVCKSGIGESMRFYYLDWEADRERFTEHMS